MTESLDKLYACLQLLSASTRARYGARWCSIGRGSTVVSGPFHAAEIAYRIHTGRLDATDTVIDTRNGRRYPVGRHAFLTEWLDATPENERRILRGLLLCVRRSAQDGALPTAWELPSWMDEVLTATEKRAFEVMKLQPTSSVREVRRRHRELVVSHHPDRGGAEEKMKEINWAYEIVQRVAGF